jgi:alpha-ketoglutarate-dependent taurine dioxygenase
MRIEPLDATLGAVVTDVRLADLDQATWKEVERAFDEHAVLVFPGQHLTKDEQLAFATRFGVLEDLGYGPGNTPIANTTRDGDVRPADDPVLTILRGNEGWHTDSSYMPLAAKASMLSAHVVPSRGGRTEWADMRAAYDALDDATKERIAPLAAHHSYIYSQEKMGEKVVVGSRYGFHDGPAPLRPLVKVHPTTGRPALFIGRHAYGIPGLSEEESESLLATLLEEACQPPRLYSHDWSVGDIIVWDNRCVLHRAQPWAWDEPRVMFHTRISGDPKTELA